MASLNPYLLFNGTCEEAFNLYKSVFGGEFQMISKFKDMPGEGVDPKYAEHIMHVALPVGGKDILMGSDCGPENGNIQIGSNFSVAISTTSEEETRKIFDGLAAGGRINMPLDKTFWAPLFGMVTDKFDINWMVSFDAQPQ